jgi:hypothetical protein
MHSTDTASKNPGTLEFVRKKAQKREMTDGTKTLVHGTSSTLADLQANTPS